MYPTNARHPPASVSFFFIYNFSFHQTFSQFRQLYFVQLIEELFKNFDGKQHFMEFKLVLYTVIK